MELEQKRWEIYSTVLASTGISLVYSKTAATASYDLRTKTVTLPVWDCLDETATQALASHEIGHARHSDYSFSAFAEFTARYRDLFNVVEDARIERLMKQEFQGLSAIFKEGYATLAKEKIFPLDGIESAPLVERLNVFAKFGFMKDVPFSKEESPFAYRILNLSTKTDVVDLCEDILSYLKETFEQRQIEQSGIGSQGSDSDEMKSESSSRETGEDGGDSDTEGKEGESSGERDNGERGSECGSERNSKFLETELTDSRMREMYSAIERSGAESRLGQPSRADTTVLMNSERILEAVLAPFKPMDFRNWQASGNVRKRKAYAEIAEKAAQAAASLFIQKQSALENAGRRKKTIGRIDTKRLAHYGISDAVFRQIEKTPKGKSHGIVLLLDYSTSMATSEQILSCAAMQAAILARFCQLVKIPFSIYLYGCQISPLSGWNRYAGWQVAKIADSSWADIEFIVSLGFSKQIKRIGPTNAVTFTKNNLYAVCPGGNTPTIEAVIAARRDILEMKRSGVEKPVLFVATDGAFNTYVQAERSGCVPSNVTYARDIRLDLKPYGEKEVKGADRESLKHSSNLCFELLCGYLKKETGASIVFSSIASESHYRYNAEYWDNAKTSCRTGNVDIDSRFSCIYGIEAYLFKHSFIFGEDIPEAVLKSIESGIFTEARLEKDTLINLFLLMNTDRIWQASKASASMENSSTESLLSWLKASNEILKAYRQLAVSFVNFFA